MPKDVNAAVATIKTKRCPILSLLLSASIDLHTTSIIISFLLAPQDDPVC